jgi:hypothetical protein
MRRLGAVVTQNAMVNSPGVISVSFAAYLAVFTLLTAQDQGLAPADVWFRALSVGILALVAFLPYTYQHWLDAELAVVPAHRRILYAVGPLKMAAWFYLLILAVRYYAFGHRRAFIEAFWPIAHDAAGYGEGGRGPGSQGQPATPCAEEERPGARMVD